MRSLLLSRSDELTHEYGLKIKGPGQLTRALLKLPKKRIKKLIVMEDHEPYLDYLRAGRYIPDHQ